MTWTLSRPEELRSTAKLPKILHNFNTKKKPAGQDWLEGFLKKILECVCVPQYRIKYLVRMRLEC